MNRADPSRLAALFPPGDRSAVAVLVSGGLDSAILVGEALQGYRSVHPLYVRNGLYWEVAEQRHLQRYLEAIRAPGLRPLSVLEMPVADVYGPHWSITGWEVPGAETPDDAVFLPGRNVLLLGKAMLWCHLHDVPAVALAPLQSNPFPDATPAFFNAFQEIVNTAVGGSVRVLRPYLGLSKTEVMQRGRGLPLGLTFSCLRPVEDRHCGRCNKCAERRHAFAGAGMRDPTEYVSRIED